MFAPQETAQHLEAIRVIAILAAIMVVACWRIVIKLVLVTLVTLVIVLLGFGAFVLVTGIGMHG